MALSVFYKIVTDSVKKIVYLIKVLFRENVAIFRRTKKKLFYYQFFQILKKDFTITYFYNYSVQFKFSVKNIALLNMFHSVVFITVKSPDRVRGRATGTKRLSPFFNGISPPSYAAVA